MYTFFVNKIQIRFRFDGITQANKIMGERNMSSLYEKLGGEGAVNAAVDIFYGKVLKDDRIKQFFDGVNMQKQASKQKAFLTLS